MFFVGHDGGSSNYRLYDPITRKVIASRNVNFDENTMNNKPPLFKSYAVFEMLSDELTDQDDTESRQLAKSQLQDQNVVQVDSERKLRDRIILRRPDRFGFENYVACAAVIYEPVTLEEARSSGEAIRWKTAMDEEMVSLENNQTWILMPLPSIEKET
ncbi:hypothetical protein JTB14_004581 [Gonioctena quinquepunctata]|nr:hypothetical protein JTB14_004581 [Gonioctena quinquepunctata]